MTMLDVTGYVTFRLGGQLYATPLAAVREIVRLAGLSALPGMAPPLAGVIDLRGEPLPVLDLRPPTPVPSPRARAGDVLVLQPAGPDPAVGVAVDGVHAVVGAEALTPCSGSGRPGLLPAYVVEVRRHGDAQIPVVDLRRMCAAVAAHPVVAAG